MIHLQNNTCIQEPGNILVSGMIVRTRGPGNVLWGCLLGMTVKLCLWHLNNMAAHIVHLIGGLHLSHCDITSCFVLAARYWLRNVLAVLWKPHCMWSYFLCCYQILSGLNDLTVIYLSVDIFLFILFRILGLLGSLPPDMDHFSPLFLWLSFLLLPTFFLLQSVHWLTNLIVPWKPPKILSLLPSFSLFVPLTEQHPIACLGCWSYLQWASSVVGPLQ